MGKTVIGISWMKSLRSPWPSIGTGSLLHPAAPRRRHLHAQLRAAAKPSSQFPLHVSGDSDHWDRATFYQYHREIGISPKQQALGFLLIIVGLLEAYISFQANYTSNIFISALFAFFLQGCLFIFVGEKKRCVKFFTCTRQALNWAQSNPPVTGCLQPNLLHFSFP